MTKKRKRRKPEQIEKLLPEVQATVMGDKTGRQSGQTFLILGCVNKKGLPLWSIPFVLFPWECNPNKGTGTFAAAKY
jgi:hypothetical protein